MNERDNVLLKDMLDAARKIQTYTQGKTRIDLESNGELLGYAVVKAIEVIGEAAHHVSEETRANLSSIAWNDIIGMRNRLIHAYNSINYNVVWETATENIPALITELEKLIPPETPDET